MRVAIEPLIATLGILLAGPITIPFAAWVMGASISTGQGIGMSVVFAVLRFGWLLAVRLAFERTRKC